MELEKSVNILKNRILKMYEETILIDENTYIEYNFLEYEFSYDNTNVLKFDIFCKFFTDRFILNAINYNYAEDENYNHLLHISFLDINEENMDEKLIEFLKVIYNLNKDYTYSKITDNLILITEKNDIENEIFAKMFLKHTEINDCSVCMEKNTVLTNCGHNLCRLCYEKIKKPSCCTLCPICRNCLNCNEH